MLRLELAAAAAAQVLSTRRNAALNQSFLRRTARKFNEAASPAILGLQNDEF
jgi:hypothetical protein